MAGDGHEQEGRTTNCRSFSVSRSGRYLPRDAGQRGDGLKTLFGFGSQIKNSVDQKPDGLLLHEYFIMSLVPLHLGMRQYWRDFDALEAWSRSPPHREWWRDFLRSSRGTGFFGCQGTNARWRYLGRGAPRSTVGSWRPAASSRPGTAASIALSRTVSVQFDSE